MSQCLAGSAPGQPAEIYDVLHILEHVIKRYSMLQYLTKRYSMLQYVRINNMPQ